MNNLAIGRYIPMQSPLHRIDPRVKIFALIVLMVCCFLPFNRTIMAEEKSVTVIYWTLSLAMAGIMLILCIVLFLVGHLNFGSLFSSMKAMWFTILILMILYILLPNFATPTLPLAFRVEMWNWSVYWDSFASAGRIVLRLILVLMLTFVLTATTKPLDLTYAFEWYLTPFKLIRLPAAEIAMTITIALRFIPTLLDDVNRISKAQASRGAAFQKGGIRRKISGLTSLIIPLFVSAFLRSEDLANAMICRGYDPKAKRTRFRAYHIRFSDILVLLITSAVLAGYITLSVTGFDPFLSWFGASLP